MRGIDRSVFLPYERDFLPGEPLSRYAFALCGGPCCGLFRVSDSEMLVRLVRLCIENELPYRVFGGLTNVLVCDEGYDGIVLLNRKGSIEQISGDPERAVLRVSSGTAAAAVVRYAMENGLCGFEWAAGLPGTVGGAVYGNAGAFGSDISKVCRAVTLIDQDGEVRRLSSEEMKFAYRSSVLKRGNRAGVLLSAEFELAAGDKAEISALCEKNRAARKASQPVEEHSLGSVFKNPEGESAGKLIQTAGLKGVSIGKAAVSMKHANFITVEEGVNAADYHRLVEHVQKTVFERFGIRLEPEIEMLGFEAK